MKKWLIVALIILAVLAIAAAVFFRPVPYHVERSITIDVPAEKSFAVVQDFNEWPKWSPWLIMEPSAKVTVSGDGKSVGDVYSWSGELVGAGELEHKKVEAPSSTENEIRFIEPFASSATTGFRVASISGNPNQSKVTWLMDGKIPSMMKDMMAAWIGMDYDRGLSMLKEYCETGDVVTKLEVPGETGRPAMSYLGISKECEFSKLSDSMGQAFDELDEKLKSIGVEPKGRILAIYTEFDMIKSHVEYIAAFPVESEPESLPENVSFGQIPAHRAFHVAHAGPYRNVGNGWATGIQHLRVKKYKQSKSIMPYELMSTDIAGVPESEIRTDIYFPLK